MTKLLRAGVRRYTHSFIFWLALAVTVAVAFFSAFSAKDLYFDDFYIIIVFVALAVMITWLVGRECDEGIIRNKVICGHSKRKIFVSEILLAVGATSIMFLLFAVVFAAINSYVFTKAEFGALAKMFFDAWLVNICCSVIFVTVSSLITKRAISAVVNLILIFAIMFGSYSLQTLVEQEEYITEWEYENVSMEGADGSLHIMSTPIEGSEHLVKNPRYVGGFVRDAAETLYNILPYGHITEQAHITNDWFGYDYYQKYTDIDITWEEDENVLPLTEEESKALTVNLIFSVIVNIVICSLGYAVFRKKDFK